MTWPDRAFGRLAWATPALGLLGGAVPAFAQRLGQATDVGPPAWRVFLSLAICLGLAVAGAIALRIRLTAGGASPEPGRWRLALRNPARFLNTPRRLRIVETLRVSHHLDICLLSCDDRQFLLAATPGGATVLTPDAAVGQAANTP